MSKWKLDNHIAGKTYDLTQENMNAMIADIEALQKDMHNLLQECIQYSVVLDLIASPVRPDGTYNLDRKACEQLAKEVLTDNR